MNAPISATTLLDQASISNRALKFKLHRGGTHRRIRDHAAEELVKSQLGDEGQIVSRELFKDKNSPIYKYQRVGNEMYAYHIKATLPFGDDSSRLLPNTAYFDYTSKMQGFISQLNQLKQTIVADWPNLVSNDVAERNRCLASQGKPQTASYSDYPTIAQMESRLYVTWYPEPISTSNDFRFTLPQDLKDSLDNQITDYLAEAGRELYVRMLSPVSSFVEKLNRFTGDKGQRWHDSFVDNLNALSSELAPLNVNQDPMVTQFLGQIDAIIKPYAFAPSLLKDDDVARLSIKTQLEALETQLKGYAL